MTTKFKMPKIRKPYKVDREVTRRTSFLIADSPTEGHDQVISATLRYNSLFDTENRRRLADAKKTIKDLQFDNVRIVTVYEYAITINQGIIAWHPYKQTVNAFNFDYPKQTRL